MLELLFLALGQWYSLVIDVERGWGFGETMSEKDSPAEQSSDVYQAALLPEAPQFFHEPSTNQLMVAGTQRSRLELGIACSCTPKSPEIDVDAHIAEIVPKLGTSRGKALEYAEVGIQLARMPRLDAFIKARAHLPFVHLITIARAIAPLHDPEVCTVVEEEIARLIIPRKHGEVLRGIHSPHKFLQRVIEEIESQLRPKNLPGSVDPLLPAGECEMVGESAESEESDNFAGVFMGLEKTRILEFKTILGFVFSSAGCTRIEALAHLIRGIVEAKIVLNLYYPTTGERPRTVWLGGVGWILQLVTQAWIEKVMHIRILADGTAGGYTPTENQRAFAKGWDGTCRFPGRDVSAELCDIDHIEPCNKEYPEEGEVAEMSNLHCLCRRHHNIKTIGLWDVTHNRDGARLWTSSNTGKEAVSLGDGPLTGCERYTSDKRELRMVQALAEYNEYCQELIERSRKLVEEARGEKDADTPNPQDTQDTQDPEAPETLQDPPNMEEFGF